MMESPPPKAVRSGRLLWSVRVLFVVAVGLLLTHPASLFPLARNQCDFCFRPATGRLTYTASGSTMVLEVCDSHRRDAPRKLTALDVSYFKLIAWFVMLVPLGFSLVVLGRTLFVAGGEPIELGCASVALAPFLLGEILWILGLSLTGRIIAWVSVFFLFSAAMGIMTGSLTMPLATPARNVDSQ